MRKVLKYKRVFVILAVMALVMISGSVFAEEPPPETNPLIELTDIQPVLDAITDTIFAILPGVLLLFATFLAVKFVPKWIARFTNRA